MMKVPVTNNIKGEIGEAAVLGKRSLPTPIVNQLVEFLVDNHDIDIESRVSSSVHRGEYFYATNEHGDQIRWNADGLVEIKWPSKENRQDSGDEFVYPDQRAVFPVEVKTGRYAELERNQLDVARVIASTSDRMYPTVLKVSIENLPESFDVNVKIFGRDFG